MSLIANNNRKPAWKLVFKSLKTNRFRTFCILFTICTCTFVMTFLPCVNTLDYLTAYEDFAGEEHAVYTSKISILKNSFWKNTEIWDSWRGNMPDPYIRNLRRAVSRAAN